MSLLAACRSCLRYRLTDFKQKWVPIRHKTYGQQVVTPKSEPVDVLVYRHNHPLHIGLVMACFAAFASFLYSTAITFQSVGKNLHRSQVDTANEGEQYGRFKVDMFLYKDGKYHRAFANTFFFLTMFPLLAILYVPPRYIRAVVLLKDRRNVCLKTYVPFGPTKYITVPINQLHSHTKYRAGNPCFVKRDKGYIPFYLSGKGVAMDPLKLEMILDRK